MAAQRSNRMEDYAETSAGDWRGQYATMPHERSGGPPWGMILTTAAMVGLGIWAWQYLGPDLRRYLKIRSM